MAHQLSLRQQFRGYFLQWVVTLAAVLLLVSAGAAQATAAGQSQIPPEDMKKYSGIFRQLAQLLQKVQARIQYPAARTQSHLLPLLPESTILYGAIPNYGEVSHQALIAFREELKDNPELRAWWQKGDMATEGPKIEDGLEKFYQLSLYLGDEIVVSAANEGKKTPSVLVLAEVRKPGLKDFLREMLKELDGKSKPSARIFDVAELATAKDVPSADQPVILVRPDFVVGAADVATLRSFSARLDRNPREFASTEFGRRLAQGYEGGVTAVAGADLHTILSENPPSTDQGRVMLQRSGFSDMKYLVWEHKNVAGQAASEMELSFTGPRRGVASWLAAPGPMGSLDFVSPKAVIAISMLLKNPAEIFDDIKDLATASNPNALASLEQTEQGLNLSFREDLFSRLAGEITVEMDSFVPPDQAWKVLLKTNDPAGLMATLNKFLAASKITPAESDEDGVVYHTITIPSGQKPQEIGYAAVDGYLIIASSRDKVAEAVRLHRGGESLAKSGKFQASLPPGNSAEVSALLYEDPIAMAALSMRQASPELAELFSHPMADNTSVVMAGYGEERALREASRSGGVDAGAAMVVAAIAIPNLLRARMAANESSAMATIRTANTAQIIYSSTYPQKGYAHDLATLGPNPNGSNASSPQHASLIDSSLGGASCTAGDWCIKSGYRFTIATACKLQKCREYVVVATPVNTSSGTRNFCSTSDGVVRVQLGPPLDSPVRATECRSWAPVQ
ncbi:MAG TPA: hypothetical protein VE377_24480 [Candidatus Dormibacteraeota bacterium]|nr:hypothetical protein [Candidatus Dormibacteraeota bacterium]